MRWKIVLEGTDEFGSAHRSELTIDKDFERLSAGEIGFSVEDGKAIMAHLQQVVVNQQCEAYVLTSRFCTDCEGFRRIKVSCLFASWTFDEVHGAFKTIVSEFTPEEQRSLFFWNAARIHRLEDKSSVAGLPA